MFVHSGLNLNEEKILLIDAHLPCIVTCKMVEQPTVMLGLAVLYSRPLF